MRDQNMKTSQEPVDFPVKELLTLIGTVVLFICSIFSLLVLIGGVLMPLWFQVLWDLANIVFTIVAFVRAILLAQYLDRHTVSDEEGVYLLCGLLVIGGFAGVIGSFYSENFLAVHSLLLFVVLAIWLAFDVKQ